MAPRSRAKPPFRRSLQRKSSPRERRLYVKPGFELLEVRSVLDSTPFGAMAQDTGEYMLGTILVNVVLMESNGTIDTDTENWTPSLIQEVKSKIETGLQWWKDALVEYGGGANPLNFIYNYTHADAPVQTGYEAITNISDYFELWIEDFLNTAGVNSAETFEQDILTFNNAQRNAFNADWSFTILVANSANDGDERFQLGGSFAGAFSYAGGRFMVVPSGRPDSTFTHETGHMFWAFDEYPGGRDYDDHRGYHDAQNTNAYDANPSLGDRVNSIMSNGSELTSAFANHTMAEGTAEIIGWKDSDGDGLYDVIDVPHLLTGYGDYNSNTGFYHFTGSSAVQTLPNKNPESLRNDITINRLSRAEYRVDGGAWLTGQALGNSHQASLDFTFGGLGPGSHTLEIRTIDDRTGVVSNVFTGTTDQPNTTASSGINGFVWNDQNLNGSFESGEPGYSGWNVQLLSQDLLPLDLHHTLDPDDYAQDTVLNTVSSDVTLTAIGADVLNDQVIARDRTPSSTGTKVFTHVVPEGISASWTQTGRMLRIDFTQPATTLSLDAVGNSDFDYGRLEIYDASDNLLARYTTGALGDGDVETMTLSRAQGDIKYAIAKGHAGTAVSFDHLRFGAETSTTTDSHGAFSFPNLPAGTYNVQLFTPLGYNPTAPTGGTRLVSLGVAQTYVHADFGARPSSGLYLWHKDAPMSEDVNNNNLVTNLDAFLIISEIRTGGARALEGAPGSPAYYYDVHPDEVLNNLDAFLVIAALRAQPPDEQGESAGPAPSDPLAGSTTPPSSSSGSGESTRPLPLLEGNWLDTFVENADPIAPGQACNCPACAGTLTDISSAVQSAAASSAQQSSAGALDLPQLSGSLKASATQSKNDTAVDDFFANARTAALPLITAQRLGHSLSGSRLAHADGDSATAAAAAADPTESSDPFEQHRKRAKLRRRG